ncbi:restriction endonuclease [Vibrio parahaemolyticus]|nr:restriction endonuclease [Vibrio parahaemolyticus]
MIAFVTVFSFVNKVKATMPLFHSLQIPAPNNWQDFEQLCADLWSAKYKSDNTQMHGRTGQSQCGVDCYGQIENTTDWFGVQCKGKDGRYGNSVTIEELNAEVNKAKNFSPKLKVFVLATTAQNDAQIQALARELTEKHQKEGLFSVEVRSWDEIHRELGLHPTVISKHYPGFSNYVNTNSHGDKLTHNMQPPRASRTFVGRKDEISNLVNLLDGDSSVQICGLGGVGKSELLLQSLKQTKSQKNVIWCNIEKYISIDELLLAFLNVFSGIEEHREIERLPQLFDKYNVCIVFDGIEQSNLEYLESLEDQIHQWYSETNVAQFVLTTQVELFSLHCDEVIKLGGLQLNDSHFLFKQLCGSEELTSGLGVDTLLEFCDGHVLAITFASALTKYYGCALKVMEKIEEHKTHSLCLPERLIHNRHTSLELCLRTAYSSLSFDSRRLLWALSESPAGIFTKYIDNGNWLGIVDTATAYASLRRWHFVDNIKISDGIYRTQVLMPVRKFAVDAAISDNLNDYENILSLLAKEFLTLVAVLETTYNTPDKTPILLSRYELELPNILNVIDLAYSREQNKDLLERSIKMSSAIITYYFVNGSPDVGAKYLKTSAELALKGSDIKGALELLQQYISLSQRGYDDDFRGDAFKLLEKVESASSIDEDLAPELFMTKALLASSDSCGELYVSDKNAELFALKAIKGYECRLTEGSEQKVVECDKLSNLYVTLGTSLLHQGKLNKAMSAYKNSLKYRSACTSGVNIGQTYHQMGQCASGLGQHSLAVTYFHQSLEAFVYVGMAEYISHSSCELGYSLLEINNPTLSDRISEECIVEILIDIKRCVLSSFNTSSKYVNVTYTIRKLLGTFFLLSSLGQTSRIKLIVDDIRKEVFDNLFESSDSITLAIDKVISLDYLHIVLEFGRMVTSIENAVGTNNEQKAVREFQEYLIEIDDLTLFEDEYLEDLLRSMDRWLTVYLQSNRIELP